MSIDLPNPSNGQISQLGALETAKDCALLLHRELARAQDHDGKLAEEDSLLSSKDPGRDAGKKRPVRYATIPSSN
jgi:hypothetical protein